MNGSYLPQLVCDTINLRSLNCFKPNLDDISLATEHASITFGLVHDFNRKNQLYRPWKQKLFVVSLGK